LPGAAAAGGGQGPRSGAVARLCSQDPEVLLLVSKQCAAPAAPDAGTAGSITLQPPARSSAAAAQATDEVGQEGFAAVGGGRQQWHWQKAGLGRLQQQQQQQQGQGSGLFEAEPVSAILFALQAALDVLAPTDCAVGTTAPVGGAVTGRGGGGVLPGGEKQQQECVDADVVGAEGVLEEQHQKLLVLGEYLAQWLMVHLDDLVNVRRVLRGIDEAGRVHPGFRDIAGRVVGVVQQQVQQRYGFAMALRV